MRKGRRKKKNGNENENFVHENSVKMNTKQIYDFVNVNENEKKIDNPKIE